MLLLRGDLLRRYPTAAVYAVRPPVVLKLDADGCYLDDGRLSVLVPAYEIEVIDTVQVDPVALVQPGCLFLIDRTGFPVGPMIEHGPEGMSARHPLFFLRAGKWGKRLACPSLPQP